MTIVEMPVDTSRFLLSRVFDARRSFLFQLWTHPEFVSLWWGVRDSTVTFCELDVRPGGRWRIDMQTRSGVIYPNGGTFLDVVEDELLVYDDVPCAGSPAWAGKAPEPFLHTIRFVDAGTDRTSVSHEVLFASQEDRQELLARGMPDGLTQELDRLQSVITRLSAGR